jgi:hypothetical protein
VPDQCHERFKGHEGNFRQGPKLGSSPPGGGCPIRTPPSADGESVTDAPP